MDKAPIKRVTVANDQVAIAKAVEDFSQNGYQATQFKASPDGKTVQVEAKNMNPEFRKGFNLED